MYNLDPHGTVIRNGVKVPVILCHKDSNDLGMGGAHVDVIHWFKRYGKTMEDVRNDVAALMGVASATTPSAPSTPTTPSAPTVDKEENAVKLAVGDKVKLVSGAKYTSGKSIPSWVFSRTLYVRNIRSNGDIVISTVKTGAVTGVVKSKYITKDGKQVVGTTDTSKTPVTNTETKFSVGDKVKLVSGAKYTSGKSIPSWVFSRTLYVRQLRSDSAVVSIFKHGAVTGNVALKYLVKE